MTDNSKKYEMALEDGGRILRMNIRGAWDAAVTRAARESLQQKLAQQALLPATGRVQGILVDARDTVVQTQTVTAEISEAQKVRREIPTAVILPTSALAGVQIKRVGEEHPMYRVFQDEVSAIDWLRTTFKF